MNMVSCGEDCRFQFDGFCTRSDLTFSDVSASSKCCYFEQR